VNMKIIVFWYVAPCKLVDEGIILLWRWKQQVPSKRC
jgi:hypothetical protein